MEILSSLLNGAMLIDRQCEA